MPDTKDRKSKKNKKKQAMSEPIDLEAGEHVAEPEAPTIAKAIYEKPSDGDAAEVKTAVEATDPPASKLLEHDTVVNTSTSQTGKGSLRGTQKASIPPPPKSETKVHDIDDAIETTDDYSYQLNSTNPTAVPDIVITQHDISDVLTQEERGESAVVTAGSTSPPEVIPKVSKNEREASSVRYGDFGLEFASSKTTGANTTKIRKQQGPATDAVNISKVPDTSFNPTKVEITGRKTTNGFLQASSAAKKAKDIVDTDKSKVDVSKGVFKAKLHLVRLVSQISVVPQPPKTKTETVKAVTKQKLRLCPLISAWSIEPSQGPVAEQSAQRKVSSNQQQQKAMKTSQLPALPPFDHKSFSRFDNIRRTTDKDFGSVIELQTNDGTFSHVHVGVLRQIPRFKQFVDQNVHRLVDPTHTHKLEWSADADFDGVSATYIHWLYNGNLPTSVIDTRNERKIGDVLLRLAEEYTIGSRVGDSCYMNYIMDAFITLQVLTRWLAFCPIVGIVYENAAGFSMMRQLLADLYAFILVDEAATFDFARLEEMPKEFVVDVLESMATLKPNEIGEWYWYLKDTGKTYHV